MRRMQAKVQQSFIWVPRFPFRFALALVVLAAGVEYAASSAYFLRSDRYSECAIAVRLSPPETASNKSEHVQEFLQVAHVHTTWSDLWIVGIDVHYVHQHSGPIRTTNNCMVPTSVRRDVEEYGLTNGFREFAGFPFRSKTWSIFHAGPASGIISIDSKPAQIRCCYSRANGSRVSGTFVYSVPSRLIAVQVVWVGLVLNALTWAIAIFIACSACITARRLRRLWQRRCIYCGYDIHMGHIENCCPECGLSMTCAHVSYHAQCESLNV